MSDSGCAVSTLVCTYNQNLIVAEEYKNNEHQNCEKTSTVPEQELRSSCLISRIVIILGGVSDLGMVTIHGWDSYSHWDGV